MSSSTPNNSRNVFDPSLGYGTVRYQQGVPLTDADLNVQGDMLFFQQQRALSSFISFNFKGIVADPTGAIPTSNMQRPHCVILTGHESNDTKATNDLGVLAEQHAGSAYLDGAMFGCRPYVKGTDTTLADDYRIYWTPGMIGDIFFDDYEQRSSPSGGESLASQHTITDGTLTGVSSTTVTDTAKNIPADVDLHWATSATEPKNASATVEQACMIKFTSGAENGNAYRLTGATTSSFTVAAWSAGGPVIGDTYKIIPGTSPTGLRGTLLSTFIYVWIEDRSKEEDTNLLEPTMGIETTHRFKLRYWSRAVLGTPAQGNYWTQAHAGVKTYENVVRTAKTGELTPGTTTGYVVDANIDRQLTASSGANARSCTSLHQLWDAGAMYFYRDHDPLTGHHRQIRMRGVGKDAADTADQGPLMVLGEAGSTPSIKKGLLLDPIAASGIADGYGTEVLIKGTSYLHDLGTPRDEPCIEMGVYDNPKIGDQDARNFYMRGEIANQLRDSAHPRHGTAVARMQSSVNGTGTIDNRLLGRETDADYTAEAQVEAYTADKTVYTTTGLTDSISTVTLNTKSNELAVRDQGAQTYIAVESKSGHATASTASAANTIIMQSKSTYKALGTEAGTNHNALKVEIRSENSTNGNHFAGLLVQGAGDNASAQESPLGTQSAVEVGIGGVSAVGRGTASLERPAYEAKAYDVANPDHWGEGSAVVPNGFPSANLTTYTTGFRFGTTLTDEDKVKRSLGYYGEARGVGIKNAPIMSWSNNNTDPTNFRNAGISSNWNVRSSGAYLSGSGPHVPGFRYLRGEPRLEHTWMGPKFLRECAMSSFNMGGSTSSVTQGDVVCSSGWASGGVFQNPHMHCVNMGGSGSISWFFHVPVPIPTGVGGTTGVKLAGLEMLVYQDNNGDAIRLDFGQVDMTSLYTSTHFNTGSSDAPLQGSIYNKTALESGGTGWRILDLAAPGTGGVQFNFATHRTNITRCLEADDRGGWLLRFRVSQLGASNVKIGGLKWYWELDESIHPSFYMP
jgi:hypothetical protein